MSQLKTMRKKVNLTQVEVANFLGITQGAIMQWETGRTSPKAELLPKIAELYKCTIDELFRSPEGEATA